MSKANQKFVQADEAVSPVIGVILMVAITVVLAAVVFVLVSNLGKTSSSTPTFSLSRDESADKLSVTSADSDADWNRLALKTEGANICVRLNAATPMGACSGTDANVAATPVAAANTDVTATANLMEAGEYLEFCESTAAANTPVTITVVDTSANSVIGSFTFSDIAVCA